ncbi:hypothetical protein [Methylopila sp. 73B]|uniref:hypothetical protein n=1 Tax=Methylopila sp. 73B TaxID=1120792 RepID=UPI0003A12967|nr:hypothetical protein [Methylopila sp. 73B]
MKRTKTPARSRKYDFSGIRFGKPLVLPYRPEEHGTRQQFSNRIRQAIARAEAAGLAKGLTQQFENDQLSVLKVR